MPENTPNAVQENGGNAEEPKTFTQDQVERIVKERLARAKAELPPDYEELKAKAAKYDEAEEQAKTELERATEKAAKLEAELADFKAKAERAEQVRKAAQEFGVDAEILSRMSGDVSANAQILKEKATPTHAYPEVFDGGAAKPSLTRQEILSIKNDKERLKAIQENINLFE